MKPKKELLLRMREDGVDKRINTLLSAVHVLHCEASNLFGETEDLLIQYGCLVGELKREHSAMVKAMDKYFNDFTSMIDSKQSGKDLFEDLDNFDKVFRKWAKLSSEG